MLKSIMRKIPRPIDIKEALIKPSGLTPPKRLCALVGERDDFKTAGTEFFGYFKNLVNLQPSDKVLDVGCGLGRMAIPLLTYLKPSAEYEGFDIMKVCTNWATQNITSKYPNFHFQHVDIYNKFYNPHGQLSAKDYVFPYGCSAFDFVFATSVFTHM